LSHEKVKLIHPEPLFSFLEFPEEDLLFAECFYIGLLKPMLNAKVNRVVSGFNSLQAE
jgi:hypothetical protein